MVRSFLILLVALTIPMLAIVFPSGINPVNLFATSLTEKYMVSTFRFTLKSIEEQLLSRPQSEWDEYIAELQPHFSLQLNLLYIEDLKDRQELFDKLLNQKMALAYGEPGAIYHQVKGSHRVIMFALEPTEESMIVDLARGPLYILEQDLKRYPKEQWPELIKELNSEHPMQVSLISKDDLPENLHEFANNGNVYNKETEEIDSHILLKLDEDTWIEILDFEAYKINIQLMTAAIAYVLFTIVFAITVWSIPFLRDLKRLSKTADEFGRGVLHTRSKIYKRSVIARLATAFNKMADNIEKSMATQRELTNAIAHDLRTPLYRLRFAFEMLKDDEIEQEQKEKYERIVNSSIEDLDHLINQTLILSRYNRVSDMSQRMICQFGSELKTEVEHFRMENAHLKIDFLCHPTLMTQSFSLDSKGMIRVFRNLTSNAAKFAETQLRVTFMQTGNNLQMIIEDDGPGIDESLFDKVFEPFAQLNNEERKANKGHGLGLAIVKSIARWHDGDVRVGRSVLGGAKFLVEWPHVQPAKNAKPVVTDTSA